MLAAIRDGRRLLMTVTAVSLPELFSGRDEMAFYTDVLVYYPDNQRSTEDYLRKVVQGNQKEGFEPINRSSESTFGGATFSKTRFPERPPL
jgi:hypothetical protein